MGKGYLAGKEPFVNINNKGLGKVPGQPVHNARIRRNVMSLKAIDQSSGSRTDGNRAFLGIESAVSHALIIEEGTEMLPVLPRFR